MARAARANYTGYPTLSYGTAYFTPVLLPAKSSVTKLAFIIASPPDNSGQIARACLYTSNANGMPANLKVDGGEATLVRDATSPPTIFSFPSVTTGRSEGIYWVLVELKQPSTAGFFAEETGTSQVLLAADSALSRSPMAVNPSGSTYSAPITYGACPAVAPAGLTTLLRNSNGATETLLVGVGH
jgi:hypothetical protein